MADNTLTIEYGDDLLFRLGSSKDEFSVEAKFLLAAKLYELGRLSSGEAADLAGMGRVEFLFSLSKIGVPMSNLRPDDIEADLDFALNG
jgi:predicted HTH domain antitoxin